MTAQDGTFILCMREEEARFFAGLMGLGAGQVRCVGTLASLRSAVRTLRGRGRLISFCSDLIIPADVVDALGGECFNFHSGPPERPGYRPTAFAAAQGDTSFGVTFHRLVAKVDAGPIYATRRFALSPVMTEAQVAECTYLELLQLVQEVAPLLADFQADFVPNGDVWQGAATTRAGHRQLMSQRTAARCTTP